jgi:predicted lipoprotein with Yx(FWY)xxD motif
MKRLLILGAALFAAIAIAACGSGNSSQSASPATGASAGTVSVKSIDGIGDVLVDRGGMPLYSSNVEAGGKIACTSGCTSFWKPLTTNGMPKAADGVGALGTVKRPDGTMQVTYNGMPLYSFTRDQAGQVTGDGFKDAFGGQQFTWHVVTVGNSSGASSGGGGGSASSSGGSGYSY